MVGRALLGIAGLLFSTAAWATPAWYHCDEPRGKRVDYGDFFDLSGERFQKFESGPEWVDDGFRGLRPLVLIDEKVIRIGWGDTLPAEVDGVVTPDRNVYEIPILGRDDVSVWGIRSKAATVDIWRFFFNYATLYLVTSSTSINLNPDRLTAPSMAGIYVSACRPG